jgi:hypothetical protein
MCRAQRGKKRGFGPSAMCGKALSARWLPVRPRPVASVEFTMDVTNRAGVQDGYAASAHHAVAML